MPTSSPLPTLPPVNQAQLPLTSTPTADGRSGQACDERYLASQGDVRFSALDADQDRWYWRVFEKHGDVPTGRFGDEFQRLTEFSDNTLQSHHGVADRWMREIFGGFPNSYRRNDAPTVLMPRSPNHTNTFGEPEGLARQLGGWGNISWDQMKDLAEKMFTLSNTPLECREEFWRRFRAFAFRLSCAAYEQSRQNPTLIVPNQIVDIARWAASLPGQALSEICQVP
jgi:HNH/Endo VII superfamily toxin with a SHH signature